MPKAVRTPPNAGDRGFKCQAYVKSRGEPCGRWARSRARIDGLGEVSVCNAHLKRLRHVLGFQLEIPIEGV